MPTLLALLAPLVAVAIVVFRMRRRMPAAATGACAASGQVACVACGASAEQLVTFTCPGCHADVRDAGLATHRKRSEAAPLWALMAWTVVLVIAGGITTSVAESRLGFYYDTFEIQHNVSMRRGSDGLSISVQGAGSSVRGEPAQAELVADVLVLGGGVASLEVESPPLRGRVVDANGKVLALETPLDLPLVFRWLEAAGADPEAADTDHAARDMLGTISADVRHPLQVPPSRKPRANHDSMSSSGGSSTSSARTAPDWLPPAAIVLWSAIWLVGAWWLSRPPNTRAAVPLNSSHETPATAPASGGAG